MTTELQRLGALAADFALEKLWIAQGFEDEIAPLRRAGMTPIQGEEMLLATLFSSIDEAGRILQTIANAKPGRNSNSTQKDLIDQLESTLDHIAWELAETYRDKLREKVLEQGLRIGRLQHQLEQFDKVVSGLSSSLDLAREVRAPVRAQEQKVLGAKAMADQANVALKDGDLGDLDRYLSKLSDWQREEAICLSDQIESATREAERVYGKTTLRLVVGTRATRGEDFEYTFTLSRAPLPGVLGTSDDDTTTLTAKNRNELQSFIETNNERIVEHLTRAVPDLEADEEEGVLSDEGEVEPTQDSSAATGLDGSPTESVTPGPSAVAELRHIGGEIFSHFVPRYLRDSLRSGYDSLSIQTNELELPWELLYDDSYVSHETIEDEDEERFLCLRRPIGREPMGRLVHSALGAREQSVPGHHLRFLLLLSNHRGDLPGAEKEIHKVRTHLENEWGGRIEIECPAPSAVTGNYVRRALRSGTFDVIHYAGHARFDAKRPHLSGLLLADDEPLYAESVERLLRGRPLVFLNACETAVNINETTKTVRFGLERPAEGLVTSFLRGGAIGSIGTLWPIYDDAASAFAAAFYSLLLEGHMMGEALRRARVVVKKKYVDRITWAAYALFGDPTRHLLDW